jgi:hypothetical protein
VLADVFPRITIQFSKNFEGVLPSIIIIQHDFVKSYAKNTPLYDWAILALILAATLSAVRLEMNISTEISSRV